MNVAHLLNMTGTVMRTVHDGPADMFGDPTETSSTATFRCWIAQRMRDEDTVGRDLQAQEFDLYLEPAAAGQVEGSDRIAVAGTTYELVGPPWPAVNPRTGETSHVVATIRRTA